MHLPCHTLFVTPIQSHHILSPPDHAPLPVPLFPCNFLITLPHPLLVSPVKFHFLCTLCHVPIPVLTLSQTNPLPPTLSCSTFCAHSVMLHFLYSPCCTFCTSPHPIHFSCPTIYPITPSEITTCHVPFCCCSMASCPTFCPPPGHIPLPVPHAPVTSHLLYPPCKLHPPRPPVSSVVYTCKTFSTLFFNVFFKACFHRI